MSKYIHTHTYIYISNTHARAHTHTHTFTKLAGAVEYTDYTTAGGVRPRPRHKECPGYDTKQSDEVSVMLELWAMWSTSSLPSLRDPIWFWVVSPDRALSMDQIEQDCVLLLNLISWNETVLIFKLCTYTKLKCLNLNCFWHGNCTDAKVKCLN